MRIRNVLKTFTEFNPDNLSMNEQSFEDYKSKYLDLYDKTKSQHRKEKVSILNDIDFELELIHRDEINVAYILKLLAKLKNSDEEEYGRQKKAVLDLLAGDAKMRSKRDLIEKFINQNMPHITDSDDIPDIFEAFWSAERIQAFDTLAAEENLDRVKLEAVIGKYLFTEKAPLRDDIIGIMNQHPALKERKTTAERITEKMFGFIETFINGITAA